MLHIYYVSKTLVKKDLQSQKPRKLQLIIASGSLIPITIGAIILIELDQSFNICLAIKIFL
jgi:hypothetical protein